jgi:hypothetical protein
MAASLTTQRKVVNHEGREHHEQPSGEGFFVCLCALRGNCSAFEPEAIPDRILADYKRLAMRRPCETNHER